jgi:hypothetical protein
MCAYVNAKKKIYTFILFSIFIYAFVYAILYYALVIIKLMTIILSPLAPTVEHRADFSVS